MKRKTAFLLVLGIMGGITLAQDAPAGDKIGFVNTLAILQGTAEGRQQLTEMESYRNQKQQEMQTQSEELQALRQQYESQSRMLNPDTAAQMEQEIASKDRQLRRMQEDFEIDLNQRQSELLNRMSEKIQALIAEYAQQNGFGAIFLQSPSLPYFAPALDITANVIKIYDEKYPVAGAEQPATPAAAPATTPSP